MKMREGVKKDTSLSLLSDLFACLVWLKGLHLCKPSEYPSAHVSREGKVWRNGENFNQMLYLHHVMATVFCPDFLPSLCASVLQQMLTILTVACYQTQNLSIFRVSLLSPGKRERCRRAGFDACLVLIDVPFGKRKKPQKFQRCRGIW